MQLFRFDEGVGNRLTAFGSHDVVLSKIVRTSQGVQIGCMHVEPNGAIALHQAMGPQLFLVVQGHGWIGNRDGERVEIAAGTAVYWTDGEWHETRSENGVVAIVIEGPDLHPERFMTKG